MQSGAGPLAAVQHPQQYLEDQHDVERDNLQQEQPDRTQGGSSSSSSSEGSNQRPSWRKRLIRYGIAAIQAVLLLELAVTVVQPFLSESSKAESEDSDDSDQGFDPADILMDYFTGRRGELATVPARPWCSSAASDSQTPGWRWCCISNKWQCLQKSVHTSDDVLDQLSSCQPAKKQRIKHLTPAIGGVCVLIRRCHCFAAVLPQDFLLCSC